MKAKGQSFNLSPIFLESERSQGVKQQFVNKCKQIAYSWSGWDFRKTLKTKNVPHEE